MAYVYRHIRLDKNEPLYIGIAKDDDGQYKRADKISKRNPIHQSILNKTQIKVEILLENISWEEACAKEVEFIALYGRIDQSTGTLANLTNGGEGTLNRTYSEAANKSRSEKLKGRQFSPETLQKMKESRRKRTDSQKGYKRSAEAKLKNRLSHLGKKDSAETRKRKSEAHKGKVPWNKGKTYKFSEERLLQLKLARESRKAEALFI